MKANERRMAILETLCERRFEKVNNLAFEFGVSEWTIRQDILELSLSYPIYTKQGKYDGGVYVVDGFRMGKTYLTDKETDLLEKLSARLSGEDFATMQAILKKYKEPRRKDK